MAIERLYRLRCDKSGENYHEIGADVDKLRAAARAEGWRLERDDDTGQLIDVAPGAKVGGLDGKTAGSKPAGPGSTPGQPATVTTKARKQRRSGDG